MFQSGGEGMGEGRKWAQDMEFFRNDFIDVAVILAYLGT
jgi:hypothetical protein